MRIENDISKKRWKLWLDNDAAWENDELYADAYLSVANLPSNPPSCGWDHLNSIKSKTISLPTSVEEFFGGINIWTYHGVSWYFTELEIPDSYYGKRVTLQIEKTRLRAEIYINRILCGYDLVSETPYEVDISEALHYGESNQIAIRITNAGGTRGWNDLVTYRWGKYDMPPSHDFSVVGHIQLLVTDQCYINDVFVKNLLPANANNLEIKTEVYSKQAGKGQLNIEILEGQTERLVFSNTFGIELISGIKTISNYISIPGAKTWDINSPNLYICRVSLNAFESSDTTDVRFGFRVFEVKEFDGDLHFYLNGKRFRHKSAIDWGYYAPTGIYATEEMAQKSVQSAKDIGHTGINFHRQIGEPEVLKKADELGLYLYEEPGGIKSGDIAPSLIARMSPETRLFKIEENEFAQKLFEQKLERMIRRDRNHPSLLFLCISNEDKIFSEYREKVLTMANDLDGSRMVINSSGTNCAEWMDEGNRLMSQGSTYTASDKTVVDVGSQYCYQPYGNKIMKAHVDVHTVHSKSMFQEDILTSHKSVLKGATRYWGEVACYCGPSNWYQLAKDTKDLPEGRVAYDDNIYSGMFEKLKANFHKWNLQGTCDGAIKSIEDVSRQAGRGLMYIDGRFDQAICSYDIADGYAINGWSSGPQVGGNLPLPLRMMEDWDSGILDEGRNIKGPAEDYAYWTRPLQVAIFRNNGKYFKPGSTAEFRLSLINEGRLGKGTYTLTISLTDSKGQIFNIENHFNLSITSEDVFSQEIGLLEIPLTEHMAGGHVTIHAEVKDSSGNFVTNGMEQILLDNFKMSALETNLSIYRCEEAKSILSEAGVNASEYQNNEEYSCILAGKAPEEETLKSMLDQVKNGSKLIIVFDQEWAELLFKQGVLSKPVSEWGCRQEGFWFGNGWGYLSEFVGDNIVPSKSVVGTNGWQPIGDPQGFYPFESDYLHHVYGLWMARHDVMRVMLADIEFGKGKILLNSAYKLSSTDILVKIILLNMILKNKTDRRDDNV